jgi:dTDP-4-amino-4,6-dideoxygalactose transaminase
MIRLTVPSIGEEEVAAVREVLESGFLVQGPKVAQFEETVARYVGAKHAVAVSSGTAALHLSLLALRVGPGDIVITAAYSWPATANVIEVCGARPVFVDIRPDTFNLDPESLATALSRLMASADTCRRVKAILPVHAFGHVADMPAILELARGYDLPVIEDAACALGSKLHGQSAGAWGAIACFSFHPRKAITTGEGGMITTNDESFARRLRMLRNHGLDPYAATPDFVLPGLNYRMTELQGAIGVVQLSKLDRTIVMRRRLAGEYQRLLHDLPLDPQIPLPGSQPNYQSYVALLAPELSNIRDELLAHLRSMQIETTIGTWHIPMIRYYRERYGYSVGQFPSADRVFQLAVTLPLHEHLSPIEQSSVVSEIACAIPAASVT